jgi:hypothetical protein
MEKLRSDINLCLGASFPLSAHVLTFSLPQEIFPPSQEKENRTKIYFFYFYFYFNFTIHREREEGDEEEEEEEERRWSGLRR